MIRPAGGHRPRMIAITGATGAVGGRVARSLAEDMRTDFRLVVRDPARAPDYDTDLRVCEYADREAAVRALEGVEVLFMVSAAEAADRREQHRTFIAAAAEAGVGHVVYTSFAGAAADATFTLGRDHFDAEDALRGSGMGFTYNFGRAVGATFPTLVGILSADMSLATAIGLFTASAYALVFLSICVLPETRGRVLRP